MKSFIDSRWLLCGCTWMIFALCWILVWIASLVEISELQDLLTEYAPDFIQKMFTVPLDFVSSPAGRLAAGYEDPALLVLMALWVIARSSESISGGLGEGTLEMVLAQPVSRLVYLLAHASVTLAGCLVIGLAAWLGTWMGLMTIELEQTVSAWTFLAAAGNLVALGLFLAGITTFLSSWDRIRSRTVGLVIGFCAVEGIIEIVALQAPQFPWLSKATFFSAYQPQVLIHALLTGSGNVWTSLFDCYGILIVLGLVSFTIAAAIFQHRDLPAPL
ncbi:MAG: ABC transporter permease subunit [Pirellulales bacterium]|nr:ABC transporter permease subunit [Pirellulales bacterium]